MISPAENYIEIIGTINPETICKYLIDSGWKNIQTKRQYVKIFQIKQKDKLYQADIPLDKDLGDYNKTMYFAIETISKQSSTNIESLINELLNPSSDIIRVQLKNSSVANGSIYFEDALNMFDSSKKLLQSAAWDINKPNLFHTGKPDKKTIEFIDNCRFGQTEIGSYIISLICPLDYLYEKKYRQLTLLDDEQAKANSFTRNVVNKFISSIEIVKETIDDESSDDVLIRKIKDNDISINFLEALKNIGIQNYNSEVNFFIKWTPTVKENTHDTINVSLNSNYYGKLDKIIAELKGQIEPEETITGKVYHCYSNIEKDERKKGTIVIAYIGSKAKTYRATVELPIDDYYAAVKAHTEGNPVKIVGRVIGTTKKTIDCSNFEVL